MREMTHSQDNMAWALDRLAATMEKSQIALEAGDDEETNDMLEGGSSDGETELGEVKGGGVEADAGEADAGEEEGEERAGKKRRRTHK